MQSFEIATLIVFLTMYVGSALRAILDPKGYRESEIAFYRSGRPGTFELLTFLMTGAALALLIVHFVLETAKVSQVLLYAMVILFDLMIPFHFMPFFRERMTSTLKQKTDAQYRGSGYKRLAIAAAMVLIPLIYG